MSSAAPGSARVERTIDDLARDGFAKLERAAPPELVARLQAAARRLEALPAAPWSEAATWFRDGRWRSLQLREAGRNTNWYDCLGVDQELDAAVEQLLAGPELSALRERVLGPDHRLWYAQLRWAEPGAPEYVLHQDVYGELGFCLYLAPHTGAQGSMVFWPGSHRFPRALQDATLVTPSWVEAPLGRVDGAPGDLCVFFNKTWHGRTSASGSRRLVLLVSFAPPGPVELDRRVPPDVRARLGPLLQRLTDPDRGRSFAPAPPPRTTEQTPLSSRVETVPETLSPAAATAFRESLWAWSRSGARTAPEAAAAGDALARYALALEDLAAGEGATADVVDGLREDFGRRAAAAGLGPRAREGLRFEHALALGNSRAAHEAFDAWSVAPDDWLAGGPVLALDRRIREQLARGDRSQALATAAPLLSGDLHETERESVSWGALLGPLADAGREDELGRAWSRAFERLAAPHVLLRELAPTLAFAGARGRDGDERAQAAGLQLLRDTLVAVWRRPRTIDSQAYWTGAATLLETAERSGLEVFEPERVANEVRDPRPTTAWLAACRTRLEDG